MKSNKLWRTIGATASIAAALTLSSASFAQESDYKWPKILVVATPGTESGSFASTNGWAPILQKQVGTAMRVIPEGSEMVRHQRLLVNKNVQIASVPAAEMRFQIQGIGGYAASQPVAQRILWHHNDTPWGVVVSGDSKLKSIEDIRKGGVRVVKGMWSPPMIATATGALPAFVGLSEEEAEKLIRYVPVSSYGENCRAVVEGKADVTWCAAVSSVLSEMEGAPGGIRWLPLDLDNKEGWEGFLNHRPMVVPSKIDLGVRTAQGVDGVTSNFLYAVPADAEADFVYNMAKWIHTSFDDYKGSHPLSARMSLEHFRNYLDRSPLPIHEGTVKYLREIGAWSEEDDVWNNEAIAKMDRWIEARKAALAEARKERVKIDFQNKDFLAILAKHTNGLEGFRSRL